MRAKAPRDIIIGTRSADLHAAAAAGPDHHRRGTRSPRSSSRMAFAIPRATWHWCARSGWAFRSCSARRRRRWKRLARARKQPETLLHLPERAGSARPPKLALSRSAQARRDAGNRHADGDDYPAPSRRRRTGDAVHQPPRLRAGAVLPELRMVRALPPMRRASDRARARPRSDLPSLRLAGKPCPTSALTCFADVKPVGQGTERIEEALQQLFTGAADGAHRPRQHATQRRAGSNAGPSEPRAKSASWSARKC